MKTWRIWTFVGFAVVVLAFAAIVLALWNDLTGEWKAERSLAVYALNHSSLETITSHSVYTGPGGPLQVYVGRDAFNQTSVAFVSNAKTVISIPMHDLISKRQAILDAERYSIHPIDESLGYLDAKGQSYFRTKSTYVWEITYFVGSKYAYLYLDATNGSLVWRTP